MGMESMLTGFQFEQVMDGTVLVHSKLTEIEKLWESQGGGVNAGLQGCFPF